MQRWRSMLIAKRCGSCLVPDRCWRHRFIDACVRVSEEKTEEILRSPDGEVILQHQVATFRYRIRRCHPPCYFTNRRVL